LGAWAKPIYTAKIRKKLLLKVVLSFSFNFSSFLFSSLTQSRQVFQRIGTKFGAISEPEFAINQTWGKIHVSNGYRKCYWSMLIQGPQ